MKRFVKNVLLFLVPFILLIPLVLWFVYIGYSTGELKDIDTVILSQRNTKDSLLGLAYNEQNSYYKVTNANYYQADVIAVGTSRVMQFRKECFDSSFYNCGGGANANFDSYLNFMRNLEYTPKVVILGLDCWVFNDNWNQGLEKCEENEPIEKIDRSTLIILKTLISDWFNKKWTRVMLNNYKQNIGINGIVKSNGFRLDGSYCYGDTYLHPERQQDYRFKDTISRINNGISRFEYGDVVDDDSIRMLDDYLEYCYQNGIYVVGFTAPLAPSIFEKMSSSGNYGYIDEISSECEKIFCKYEFKFYDFLDGASLDYGDEYYVDGFHGGDIVYAEVLKRIADRDDKIIKVVDEKAIEKIIEKRDNTLTFE